MRKTGSPRNFLRSLVGSVGSVGSVASIGLALLLSGCGGASGDITPNPDDTTALLASAVTLARPAGLAATVVLPVLATAAARESRLPIRLQRAESLRQCIAPNEPYVLALRLEASDRQVVWAHERGAPCPAHRTIPLGDYTLVLTHGSAAVAANVAGAGAAKEVMIFIQAAQPAQPTISTISAISAGTPPREYWAFRHTGRQAYLRIGANFSMTADSQIVNYSSLFSVVNRTIDGVRHQILIPHQEDGHMVVWTEQSRASFAPISEVLALPLDAGTGTAKTEGVELRAAGANSVAYCYRQGRGQIDTGLSRRTMCLGVNADATLTPYRAKPFADYAPQDSAVAADTGHLVINPRYLLDARQHLPATGEVMLVDSQGSTAFIYNQDAPPPSRNFRPSSVVLGANTTLSLDGGKTYVTESGVLRWSGFDAAVSIQITTARDMLISSRFCVGCDLSGLNLSYKDLRGVDLTRALLKRVDATASDFTGATLNGADLTGAVLRHADFSSAGSQRTQLTGATFDGADLQYAKFTGTPFGCVKLRSARLRYADFSGASLQCVDMSEADLRSSRFDAALKLPGIKRPLIGLDAQACAGVAALQATTATTTAAATTAATPDANGLFEQINCSGVRLVGATVWATSPPAAQWKHMDLSNAVVAGAFDEDLAGVNLSGIDFSGGHYRSLNFGAAVLKGANFDAADLVNANLSRADLSCLAANAGGACATLRSANLRGARLTYANARRANFSGAFLSGDPKAVIGQPERLATNLSYLFAPDAVFDGSDLTGVNFAHAQIYGANAKLRGTLVRANFSGANLSGVDFSNSQLQGAKFGDANLVNANFSNAVFGLSAAGDATSFNGAFLQGTIFTLVNAAATDFTGATVAASDGLMQVVREVSPGQLGYFWVGYSATVLPALTDKSSTCPSGTGGPCEGKQWQATNPKQPSCVPSPTEFCPRDVAP